MPFKNIIVAVILPSLLGLNNMVEMDITRDEKPGTEIISKERLHGGISSSKLEFEREAECGICLEPCAKIVLPTCCHAMCINCYRDWYNSLNFVFVVHFFHH